MVEEVKTVARRMDEDTFVQAMTLKPIETLIALLSGTTITVDVQHLDSIKTLTMKIDEKVHIPPDHQ